MATSTLRRIVEDRVEHEVGIGLDQYLVELHEEGLSGMAVGRRLSRIIGQPLNGRTVRRWLSDALSRDAA